MSFNNLAPLTQRRQWVVWKLVQKEGKAKPDKILYNPLTRQPASATDPQSWVSWQEASSALPSDNWNGIGFVIAPDDPFAFIDLDNCITWENDQPLWNNRELAQIVAPLLTSGVMWEYSQSGTGIHIIASIDKTELADRRARWTTGDKAAGNVSAWEFYQHGRFCAFGHMGWQGDPTIDITQYMSLIAPIRETVSIDSITELFDRVGPIASWAGPSNDETLIKRAIERSGKNNPDVIFNAKSSFSNVWNVDDHVLAASYPATGQRQDGKIFDYSAVDAALMSMLAFWTGKDTYRMVRIFQQWKGYRKDKYETRHGTYLFNRLLTKANSTKHVYNGNYQEQREKRRKENELIGDGVEDGFEKTPIMTVDECHQNLVMIVPGDGSAKAYVGEWKSKRFYSWHQALIKYAGSLHPITVQGKDGSIRERMIPAIEEFKNTTLYHLDGVSWSPSDGATCKLDNKDERGFNLWKGLHEPRFAKQMLQDKDLREKHLERWHTHLNYLIPDTGHNERHQFEQWLGHILQEPGSLPQFAWLMITEQTGIGRNWVASVLTRVLRGHSAPNVDFSEVMNSNYTGRFSRKLIAIVDETKAGMEGKERWSHKERIKNMINGEMRFINVKGGAQYNEQNCMRWLFFSNNWDAIALDRNDRRFNIVANPTQHPPDGHVYYKWLYDTLNDEAFISAVWAHLMTYPLDGFNPGDGIIENDARRRVMLELSSDLEMACQDFMDACNYSIFLFKDLKNYINHSTGKKYNDRIVGKILRDLGCDKVQGPFNNNKGIQVKSVWIKRGCPFAMNDIRANGTHHIEQATSAGIASLLTIGNG